MYIHIVYTLDVSRNRRLPKIPILYFLCLPYSLYLPHFIQVMIQNPTPVLMNHATSVILNACENARKLSTFAFTIIANS